MAIDTTYREKDPKVRIAGFLKRSTVNGPGLRSVIWTQGCPIRCEGCFNSALWNAEGGRDVGIDSLLQMITATMGIDGITLSGGEPFFQAGPLADLAIKVHSHGLSVLTFSGYSYETLIGSEDRSWKRLIQQTDLLVAGPYRRKQSQDCPAAQPADKEFHDFTGRIEYGDWTPEREGVIAEYVIAPDGIITTTGYPDSALAERFGAPTTTGGQ